MFSKIVAALAILAVVAEAKQIQLKNGGSKTLIVSVTGQNDVTLLNGATVSVTVADNWNGRISARPSVCNGGCDGPRTLSELNLSASGDFYDVSLIDGFNLPAKIVPVGGTNCKAAVCSARINNLCPVADQVKDNLGNVVACRNSPEVMKKVCPGAIVTPLDSANVSTCNAISYIVLLG